MKNRKQKNYLDFFIKGAAIFLLLFLTLLLKQEITIDCLSPKSLFLTKTAVSASREWWRDTAERYVRGSFSWQQSLEQLKIKDPLDGSLIAGVTIPDWFYRRDGLVQQLYAAFQKAVRQISSSAERDQRIQYTNIIRSWNLRETKEFILKYAEVYLDQDQLWRVKTQLDSIKRKHLDMVRHTYFVKRWRKQPLSHLIPERGSQDEEAVKNLRSLIFEAVSTPYKARFRRFKKRDDIRNLRFWDLPIWPVDDRGRILTDLMKSWVHTKTKLPPYQWRTLLERGQIKSLAEITGLKNPPQVERPAVQLSLFDTLDVSTRAVGKTIVLLNSAA